MKCEEDVDMRSNWKKEHKGIRENFDCPKGPLEVPKGT